MPFFKPKKPKQKFDFKPPQAKASEKIVSVEEQISIEKTRCAQMMAAAEAAVKRAEEALKGMHELGSEEAAAVQAALAKSLAQLHVKRRRRSA